LSKLQGQPATLFRVLFAVAGNGLTSISIEQKSSQLTSFSGGCGDLLPFTVGDLSFDNRAPFIVSSTPSSKTVGPGQSFTTLVNVSLVNSAGYGIVDLTLSKYVPPLYTKALYSFNPVSGSLYNSGNGQSFTSHLTINTNSSVPMGTYTLTIIGVIPSTPFNRGFQVNLDFPLTIAQVSPMILTAPQASLSHGTVILQTSPGYSPDTNTSSLLASFTTNNSPTAGTAVTFAAIAVWCSSPPYTLQWNFGDGSTGNSNPAAHSYSKAGTYNVTLSVIDASGNNYSSSQRVTVANPQQSSDLDPVIISSIILLFLVLSTVFLLIRRQSRSRRS
jgi:PKD repeat protein